MFAWLRSYKEVLFVEVGVKDRGIAWAAIERSACGVKQDQRTVFESSERLGPSEATEEWVWEHQPLVIRTTYATDLWLRVLAGSITGHGHASQLDEPLQILGEARFSVGEDVVPAVVRGEPHGGDLQLNIVQNFRTKGSAWLAVRLRGVAAPVATDASKIEVQTDMDPSCIAPPAFVALKGHTANVTCCACFPDGERVLTGSEDGCCILWDRSGEQTATLQGEQKIVGCGVFPSGDRFLSVSEDSIGTVWDSTHKAQLELDNVRVFA